MLEDLISLILKEKTMLFHSVQLNPQELQSARDLAALTHVKSYNQVLPSNPQLDLKKTLDNL